MNVSLFSFVGMYARGLETLSHLLTKAREHAASRGISEAAMMEWRLAPDMFPLRRQAQIVCNFAKQWPARATGALVPDSLPEVACFEEIQRAIVDAKEYLRGFGPADFAARDDVMLMLDIGPLKPTMPIGQWMVGFATTNFYFHLSIAYAILRAEGVPLTKPDLFAGGL